jgi:hypothetical protein
MLRGEGGHKKPTGYLVGARQGGLSGVRGWGGVEGRGGDTP